jgi:hypothetical protein
LRAIPILSPGLCHFEKKSFKIPIENADATPMAPVAAERNSLSSLQLTPLLLGFSPSWHPECNLPKPVESGLSRGRTRRSMDGGRARKV